ncbi:MAG TPA: Arm DNA-binding domain-containing protein, partial [Ilumatobacteraceae bacterium]|nr:Arm DNA-binding domain-containing protein [Ilumatobacteraceae bacterium]
MGNPRTAPGMRERMPGVWEIVVQAGRDPITGKHRQISRTFRGSLREAKKARAELIVEVGKGRHTGS